MLAGAVVSGAGVAELALGAGSIVSVGGLATGLTTGGMSLLSSMADMSRRQARKMGKNKNKNLRWVAIDVREAPKI